MATIKLIFGITFVIKVVKEKYESQRYEWNGDNSRYVPYTATRTTIKSVDNDNG